jgi:hypothetical protein
MTGWLFKAAAQALLEGVWVHMTGLNSGGIAQVPFSMYEHYA